MDIIVFVQNRQSKLPQMVNMLRMQFLYSCLLCGKILRWVGHEENEKEKIWIILVAGNLYFIRRKKRSLRRSLFILKLWIKVRSLFDIQLPEVLFNIFVTYIALFPSIWIKGD